MNRTSFRKALAPSVAVLALSITLSACGAGNETTDTGTGTDDGAAETGSLTGDLSGGGASSQEKARRPGPCRLPGGLNPDVTAQLQPARLG